MRPTELRFPGLDQLELLLWSLGTSCSKGTFAWICFSIQRIFWDGWYNQSNTNTVSEPHKNRIMKITETLRPWTCSKPPCGSRVHICISTKTNVSFVKFEWLQCIINSGWGNMELTKENNVLLNRIGMLHICNIDSLVSLLKEVEEDTAAVETRPGK